VAEHLLGLEFNFDHALNDRENTRIDEVCDRAGVVKERISLGVRSGHPRGRNRDRSAGFEAIAKACANIGFPGDI
jgi:hypothetical protein